MPTTTRRRHEDTYSKAERILSDPRGRVHTISAHGTDYWLGLVEGDHGTYRVCAVSREYADRLDAGDGTLSCRCPAGLKGGRKSKPCSHALVGEEMRLRGEDS
jgi:hypothetical protein